jgi:hypothetical protein
MSLYVQMYARHSTGVSFPSSNRRIMAAVPITRLFSSLSSLSWFGSPTRPAAVLKASSSSSSSNAYLSTCTRRYPKLLPELLRRQQQQQQQRPRQLDVLFRKNDKCFHSSTIPNTTTITAAAAAAATSTMTTPVIPSPTSQQKWLVFGHAAVPMIGFGFIGK